MLIKKNESLKSNLGDFKQKQKQKSYYNYNGTGVLLIEPVHEISNNVVCATIRAV